jgi:hypothetical protein
MSVEERIFYPAVRGVDEARVLESYEEHAAVEVALERLLATHPLDVTFPAKVKALKELIALHVELEEEKLFPDVESRFSVAELKRLGVELEEAFEDAIEEGHESIFASRRPPRTSADENNPAHRGRESVPSHA